MATTNGAVLHPDGITCLTFTILNGFVSIWVNGLYNGSCTINGGLAEAISDFIIGGGSGTAGSTVRDFCLAAVYNTALSDSAALAVNQALTYRYVPLATHLTTKKDSLVVFSGDSRMWGFGVSYQTQALPNQTMALLGIPEVDFVNTGVPGSQINSNTAATDVLAYANASRYASIAVLLSGVNDISAGSNAATIYASMKTWAASVQAAGFKAIVCTPFPNGASHSTIKDTLCASLIADTTHFDAVVDFNGNTTIVSGGEVVSTYGALHLNDLGNAVIAPYLAQAIASLFPASPANPSSRVVAQGRQTGQTGSVASLAYWQPGYGGGSFAISCNINVTTFNVGTLSGTVSYTDDAGNAVTLILNFSAPNGTISTGVAASGSFNGLVTQIRTGAFTTITVSVAQTGSGSTYNCEAFIVQL